MNINLRWKERWLLLHVTQILAVVFIAVVMSLLGSTLLMRGRFEDAGSGMMLSSRTISPYTFMLPSLIAWILLAPFLYRARFWLVVPVGLVAPFLGSAGFIFGLFCFGGPLGVLPATGFTYIAWTFVLNSAVVMFPTSLLTAILMWSILRIGYQNAV